MNEDFALQVAMHNVIKQIQKDKKEGKLGTRGMANALKNNRKTIDLSSEKSDVEKNLEKMGIGILPK